MRTALGLMALAASAAAFSFRPASPPKPLFDCTGKPVGVYGMPKTECSVYYFICPGYNRPAKKLPCPGQQVFDKTKKICVPSSSLRACSPLIPKPAPPPPANPPAFAFKPKPAPAPAFAFQPKAPPPPKIDPIPARPPPAFFNPPRPAPAPKPAFSGYAPAPKPSFPAKPPSSPLSFDCSNKADGDYSDGCSHIYYSCRGQLPIQRTCALTELKFDSQVGECGMPDVVTDCGGAPKVAEPEEKFPEVEKDPRCEGLPSGIFEMPGETCSGSFLSCNDGFGEVMSCGGGNLKFDVETGMCMGAQYVGACGGKATPIPELTTTTRAPLDPSINCDGKADGDYPIPGRACAYGFYSCFGGFPELRQCPGELRFDAGQSICEEQQFIPDCGGQPRPQEDPTTTHAPFVTKEEFSCDGKKPGLYDDHYGCSAVFYACTEGGEASKFKCAGANMAYDPESERCVEKQYVKACGGAPTPIPEIVDDAGTPMPPPAIEFDCAKAGGDGRYAQGCSNEYVVCSFGRPYPKKCPGAGLKFDVETQSCQASAFIKDCGGVPTPKPTPPPPPPPAEPVPFDCAGKLDGMYSSEQEPCGEAFFACDNGAARAMKCPPGLAYKAEEGSCIAKAFIPGCAAAPAPQPKFKKPSFGGYRPSPQFHPRSQPQFPAPRPPPQQQPPVFKPKPRPQVFQPLPRPSNPYGGR